MLPYAHERKSSLLFFVTSELQINDAVLNASGQQQ